MALSVLHTLRHGLICRLGPYQLKLICTFAAP